MGVRLVPVRLLHFPTVHRRHSTLFDLTFPSRQHLRTMSSTRGIEASLPRPSASLIVVNDKNEILLVQRNPKATSFSGMHVRHSYLNRGHNLTHQCKVFPGGNYDEQQDGGSFEMTAIRETFEESGLLLASPSASISDEDLDVARYAIHAGKTLFRDFLSQNNLIADVSSLLPFTQWITPPSSPRSVLLCRGQVWNAQ